MLLLKLQKYALNNQDVVYHSQVWQLFPEISYHVIVVRNYRRSLIGCMKHNILVVNIIARQLIDNKYFQDRIPFYVDRIGTKQWIPHKNILPVFHTGSISLCTKWTSVWFQPAFNKYMQFMDDFMIDTMIYGYVYHMAAFTPYVSFR